MINKRIEIVSSNIRELSSMSSKSRLAIADSLRGHYAHVGITLINKPSDLIGLLAKRPDVVLLGMMYVPLVPVSEGDSETRVWLNEFLSRHGIATTGSVWQSHLMEKDKQLAKLQAQSQGLKTAPFFVTNKTSVHLINKEILDFPLFVKPTNKGGGLGVDNFSVVHNYEEMISKVGSISDKFNTDSLIEVYLPGREFSVAIIKSLTTNQFKAMPLELIAPVNNNGDKILSSQVKSSDTEKFVAVNDDGLKTQLQNLALNVFKALNGRDYGRIDIRLDKFGVANFLEANLIPSLLKDYGNFPKACKLNAGIDYETMLLTIVQLALKRTSATEAGLNIQPIYPHKIVSTI
ncbi:MAG: D-alanine--D-alanine ligase [bacterium]|nr:D-alanine--D-alanine ligase [bacterium]